MTSKTSKSGQVKAHPSWTKQEKWVWQKLCAGEIANFNEAEGYGGELNPKELEGWTESRILRAKFIETILLQEPYRGALTKLGVYIIGAWFKEPLDLENAIFAHRFALLRSRFDSDINLSFLKTPCLIGLSGSIFRGKLDMGSLRTDSHCFIDDGTEFLDEVYLQGAKIGGQVVMVGSKFSKKLDMSTLEAGEGLFMDGAEFLDEVLLGSAKVGGTLEMDSSKFQGKINMDKIEVAQGLYMRYGAEFSDEIILRRAKIKGQLSMMGSKFRSKLNMSALEVDGSLFMGNINIGERSDFFDEIFLVGAKINGQLGMNGSKFKGMLNMENIRVSESLFMMDSIVENLINMIFSEIGANLFIAGSKLENFDLTGSKIKGEFCLGSGKYPPAQWKRGAKLILCNTEVGALQDLPESWPDKIDLDGFIYKQLGGFAVGESDSFTTRTLAWMKTWLEKQKVFSPQPYKQLSNILNETGHGVKANDILYACKEQERSKSKCLYWLWMILQRFFIGYGYRIYYLLFWVAGLTFLGAVILNLSGQGSTNGMPYGIAYSLDMLLPLIRLNDIHYTIQLFGFAKYYFYFQKIAGYFLVSLLIYGISEIVRKPRQ